MVPSKHSKKDQNEKNDFNFDEMDIVESNPIEPDCTECNHDASMDTDVEPECEMGIIVKPEELGGIIISITISRRHCTLFKYAYNIYVLQYNYNFNF